MPDVLIFGDTFRSPELRHEVPLGIPDPFLYVERDGVKHIVISSMEVPRLAALGLFELHPSEEFGSDELIAAGRSYAEIRDEVVSRAVKSLGVTSAVVPETFPLWLADRLRADGVELVADAGFFDARRRVKSDAELAGMRRAQRAAEAGMDAARDLLRRATPNGQGLLLDGEPLTVERVKSAMAQTFVAHGTTADEFIVAPGAQGAVGHDMGSGAIHAGVPIVIDIWPRDNESFIYCDMTRTFVVGDVPEDVRDLAPALQGGARPRDLGDQGRRRRPRDLRRDVRDLRSGRRADPADEGAGEAARERLLPRARPRRRARGARAAGPGPGGEAAARRRRRRRRSSPAATGPGFGGVRLEDLVLVTADGAENLTRYPYELEP